MSGWPPDALHPPLPGPSGSAHADEANTIQLSPVAVALAGAVLLINGAISLRFKLGLHSQLLIASVRWVLHAGGRERGARAGAGSEGAVCRVTSRQRHSSWKDMKELGAGV